VCRRLGGQRGHSKSRGLYFFLKEAKIINWEEDFFLHHTIISSVKRVELVRDRLIISSVKRVELVRDRFSYTWCPRS
jgi:hypothetical protein